MPQLSLKYWFVIWLACFSWLSSLAQNFSSYGTDFYIPASPHYNSTIANQSTVANQALYISARQAATGTVQVGNISLPFTVEAGGVRRLFIGPGDEASAPGTQVYLDQIDGIKTNAAIRVVSNSPVTVFAHVIATAIGAASLCLPTNTWGLKYIASGIQGNAFGRPFINVMAKEANTTIEITPKAPVFNNNRPVGQPFRITLANPGDVYQIQFSRTADISGTIIQSVTNNTEDACKTIGVFAGSTYTAFGCEIVANNNLYQQLFPSNTWGEIFFARPMAQQLFNILRVYGQKEGTVVDVFNGTIRIDKTIGVQGWVEFEIREPVQITATSPVMAVQFMPSQWCDNRNTMLCPANNSCPFPGGPAMVVLNPITQYIDTISVFSALQQWVPNGVGRVTKAFFTIAIPDEGVANFRINGAQPTGTFIPILGTGYSTLQENVTIQASTNPVQLLTSTVPFSCIAHGVGTFSSYAYNAGSQFKDVTQTLSVINMAQNIRDSVCSTEDVKFQLQLPYRISRVQWLVEDSLLATENPGNPASAGVRPNGDSIFTYRSGINFRFNEAGRYNLKALVNGIGAVDCIGQQEANGVVTVFLTPVPGFSLPPFVCSGQNVSAIAQRSGVSQNTQWQWLISNGTRLTGDNINLNLTQPGTYTIRQWGESATGCNSDTVTANLVVGALPVAAFNPSVRLCSRLPFTILDASVGNITNRNWLVNNQPQATTGNALTLVRDTFGTISIGLRVTDERGCQSAVTTRNFAVAENPKANFLVPGICLDDATAIFTNTTTFQTNPPASISYQWNYGNPTAPGNTNTGTTFTGQHRYSATGNYPITLIATSPEGCRDTITKMLTVNGSNPRAAFRFANTTPFCSEQPLAFINRSTVGFGNITRLVWFWNWPSNPRDSTEVLSPAPGDTTLHTFTLPAGVASGSFTIRLQAFSGIVCVQDTTASIRIEKTPQVALDALPVLCSNAAPVQLTQGRVTNGLAGTGVYTGEGISNNVLNPALITGNNLSVRYTFITNQGCSAFANQPVQIIAAPVVSAGPDKTIIVGGRTTLEGSVLSGGSNASFVWTPVGGLTNANTLQPFASPAQTTTYTLVATTSNCTAEDSMVLTVQLLPIVPNAFSPNSDGINDVWLIQNLSSYTDVRVMIFDRYGQTVLNSIGYSIPWDGTYKGRPVPVGVYYYTIESRVGKIRQNGSVTVIR
jgi:gliding motility-associated-like protein